MAITKIQSESLNLADDFAFTGTITGAGESNKPVFMTSCATASTSNNVWTKMQISSPAIDTCSGYDGVNYRYTPNVAGYYYINIKARLYTNPGAPNQLTQDSVSVYKNGSGVFTQIGEDRRDGAYPYSSDAVLAYTIEMNGTTDYLEFYFRINTTGSANIDGGNTNIKVFYLSST